MKTRIIGADATDVMRHGSPRVLMAVGGVGLGNSTRCGAVIRHLGDCEIRILGFGCSADYFERHGATVVRLRPMRLATSLLGRLTANVRNFVGFVSNVITATRTLRAFRPDVVVADSEYSVVIPARLLGVPVVGINNASVIVALWRRFGGADIWLTFFGREVPDALLSRLYDRVLAPTFTADVALPANHVAIPPIVRALPPRVPRDGPVLLLRGGSEHCSPVRLPEGLPYEEIGAGRTVEDALERIARARVVICQGGFSSLSEVLALGAPAVVVPLPGHAEQVINARLLAEMGAVQLADGPDVAEALERALAMAPAQVKVDFEGAAEAARHIVRVARSSPRVSAELIEARG